MNLDGTDAREFTRAGEGLPYGLSLSPDGRRVAFHLASPRGYEVWTCDGPILFPRKLPGSKVAWESQPQRPDTDHFNRDFKPELAHGGTEVCRLNPQDGSIMRLTQSDPPVWDFRASESPEGRQIIF